MNKSLTDRPKSGGALRNVENRSDSGGSSAIANSVPDRAANSLLLETRNLQEMPLSIETAVKFGLATRLPTRFMAHSLLIRIDESRAAALLGVRYAMAFRKAGRPVIAYARQPTKYRGRAARIHPTGARHSILDMLRYREERDAWVKRFTGGAKPLLTFAFWSAEGRRPCLTVAPKERRPENVLHGAVRDAQGAGIGCRRGRAR